MINRKRQKKGFVNFTKSIKIVMWHKQSHDICVLFGLFYLNRTVLLQSTHTHTENNGDWIQMCK